MSRVASYEVGGWVAARSDSDESAWSVRAGSVGRVATVKELSSASRCWNRGSYRLVQALRGLGSDGDKGARSVRALGRMCRVASNEVGGWVAAWGDSDECSWAVWAGGVGRVAAVEELCGASCRG